MTGILAGLIGSFKKAFGWLIISGEAVTRVYTSGVFAALTNGNYFFFCMSSTGGTTATYSYSTTGITFSNGSMPATSSWVAAAASSTRIIAFRKSAQTGYYTDNGTTWTATGSLAATNFSPTQAIWDGTRFILPAGDSRNIYYSTDGTGSWSATGTSIGISTGAAQHIGYDGTSRHIVTSTSSTTQAGTTTSFPSSWSLITMPSTGVWLSPVYGNNIWVAATAGGTSYGTSTNGITWTSRTLPSVFSETTTDVYTKMIFTNGKFYYYYTNNLYSSTDGINWTTEATVTGGLLDNANGWAVGSGKILAFGYDSLTAGSSDYLIGQ